MSDGTSRFGEIADANDTAAAVAAGVTLADPVELSPEEIYLHSLPAGGSREVVDLERFLPAPRRAKGTASAQTVDDLIRYVQRHDDVAATTLWVDTHGFAVVGVLDDHAKDAPAWGDHRVRLALALTPEWQRWTRLDGKLITQEDFAEHIELGLPEIEEPDGATLLEIAQSIEGTKSAEFKQGRRLQDGNVQIEYVEQTQARAGQRGDLEIPARFKLAIAPFLGEEPRELWARFRYRIHGGHLQLGYLLERPDLTIRDAIDAIADKLADEFGRERVFVGIPR